MDQHELETHDSYIGNKTYTALSNHPLAVFIMRESPLIVLSKIDANLFVDDQHAQNETLDEYLRNPKHFKGICKFLVTESRLFYNLGLRIDKLQHTIYMLKFFPRKTLKNSLPFTQAEYVENVMELYIVNTLGIYDRILEFTNLLYDLKIPKKSLNKKREVTDRLQDVKLLKELRLLDQIFSDIRKSRNDVVHESFYYSEELENIFQAELRFRQQRDEQGLDAPMVKKRAKEIDRYYDDFIYDKMEDIYINDSILTKTIQSIFDEFYKQHLTVLKEYGHHTTSQKSSLVTSHANRQDSIRKHSSLYSLEIDDIMRAIDAASEIGNEDVGNFTKA